jgi:HEAT repeat protein
MRSSRQEVEQQLLERLREQHGRAPRSPERRALEAVLEERGIDPTDLGMFTSLGPTTFDAEAAAPVLVEWLPRMTDRVDKEVIARSLAGTKSANVAAAAALVEEFRQAPSEAETTKWAYANTLATIAGPENADDLVELVRDRRHGITRQMLCDALKRTKDPRAPDVLIELIEDDDVAGHAILALRRYGPKSGLPHLRRARPELEAVLERETATPFAKRQARAALTRLDS